MVRRVRGVLALVIGFTADLVMSNLRVAGDVLSWRSRRRPGIVAVPLRATTDLEVSLLAQKVTLTPGTLSLAVERARPDRPAILYVHAMFVDDPDELRRQVAVSEARLLAVLRSEWEAAP